MLFQNSIWDLIAVFFACTILMKYGNFAKLQELTITTDIMVNSAQEKRHEGAY